MIEISDQITITKEPAIICGHLIDISNWGRWSRIIKHAAIYGPATKGTSFKCIAGKWDFEGKITAIDPGKSVEFEADSFGLTIKMIWLFSNTGSETKVTVNSNIEGWIPKLLSKRVLESFQISISIWLNSLKARAERGIDLPDEPPQNDSPPDKQAVQYTDALSLFFKSKTTDK